MNSGWPHWFVVQNSVVPWWLSKFHMPLYTALHWAYKMFPQNICLLNTSICQLEQIWNLGRPLKSFANASLNIYWPKENTVGKWLLYLVQIHSEGIQNVPCSPLKEISPVQHIKVNSSEHPFWGNIDRLLDLEWISFTSALFCEWCSNQWFICIIIHTIGISCLFCLL